jgi:hypothetical protein
MEKNSKDSNGVEFGTAFQLYCENCGRKCTERHSKCECRSEAYHIRLAAKSMESLPERLDIGARVKIS